MEFVMKNYVKKQKKNKFLEIRIIKVKLKTGEIELLAINLTKE